MGGGLFYVPKKDQGKIIRRFANWLKPNGVLEFTSRAIAFIQFYWAEKVAAAEFRSIPNQIEYWAKLGKCALDNPDLPIEFIKDVLLSKLQDKSLAEPFQFEGEGE